VFQPWLTITKHFCDNRQDAVLGSNAGD